MATCVSSESHPFTPSPSFTLKPRGEKSTSSASHFGALRLSPSFGRGLRICSSLEGQDQALFDAHNFEDQVEPPSMAIEPPTWAVKANGEARLEPVGPTASNHDPLDLSTNPCFQVGRSPSSDMQLIHPTSSRKHALIFHHPNGSCYVVDCGSSHGTFVNGVRIASPTTQQGSDQAAAAAPHRVRKGSLIRFGGTGAPTFVLKSFTTSLEVLVAELNTGKTSNHSSSCIVPAVVGSHSPTKTDLPAKGEKPSMLPTLSPTTPTPSKKPKLQACSPETALVALNTRVNALGGGASLNERNLLIAKQAALKFATAPDQRDQIDSCLLGKRTRFNSDVGFDTPSFDRVKRVRSASFPASFPLILSPNPACSIMKIQEDDARSDDLTETPLVFHRAITSSNLELDLLSRTEEREPKVTFQEEVENFYPASVTPDEAPSGSFDRLLTPNLESMVL